MKKLKNKRGFSLVELMVVVAIMGTLAAIAIPAYNEYRKSAKKTAYKTDLLSLHKGWQAFGVELDSYCERETTPKVAGFKHVGMESLVNSNLYLSNPGKVNMIGFSQSSSACLVDHDGDGGTTAVAQATAPLVSATTGVFGIGIADAATTDDPHCELDVADYLMGVFGHISGDDFTAFEINENGVVEDQGDSLTNAQFTSTCDV